MIKLTGTLHTYRRLSCVEPRLPLPVPPPLLAPPWALVFALVARVAMVAAPEIAFRARVEGRTSSNSGSPSCLARLRFPRLSAGLSTSIGGVAVTSDGSRPVGGELSTEVDSKGMAPSESDPLQAGPGGRVGEEAPAEALRGLGAEAETEAHTVVGARGGGEA